MKKGYYLVLSASEVEALKKVVNHFYNDEWMHYQEMIDSEEYYNEVITDKQESEHIFHSLKILAKGLEHVNG